MVGRGVALSNRIRLVSSVQFFIGLPLRTTLVDYHGGLPWQTAGEECPVAEANMTLMCPCAECQNRRFMSVWNLRMSKALCLALFANWHSRRSEFSERFLIRHSKNCHVLPMLLSEFKSVWWNCSVCVNRLPHIQLVNSTGGSSEELLYFDYQ